MKRVFSGAPWEKRVGYCRAIQAQNHIYVTGCAPVEPDGSTTKGGAYEQAKRCFEVIKEALAGLDAGVEHVVRTGMFVTDISQWEEYGRAHHEVFSDHPPATTMVEVSKLIDPEMLIEIEADAVLA